MPSTVVFPVSVLFVVFPPIVLFFLLTVNIILEFSSTVVPDFILCFKTTPSSLFASESYFISTFSFNPSNFDLALVTDSPITFGTDTPLVCGVSTVVLFSTVFVGEVCTLQVSFGAEAEPEIFEFHSFPLYFDSFSGNPPNLLDSFSGQNSVAILFVSLHISITVPELHVSVGTVPFINISVTVLVHPAAGSKPVSLHIVAVTIPVGSLNDFPSRF